MIKETYGAVIDYTNWRGSRRERVVVPCRISFEKNEWHPEPQWLLWATDVEDGALKTFALSAIHSWKPPNGASPWTRAADDVIAERTRMQSQFDLGGDERLRIRAVRQLKTAADYAPNGRRRFYIRAAAFILAEIERLDRMDDLAVSDQRTPHDK